MDAKSQYGEIKKQYSKIEEEKGQIKEEIKKISKNELVKKFLELQQRETNLEIKSNELYKAMKFQEYASCKHIWITTVYESSDFEGRSYDYCKCLKCGLDEWLFYLYDNSYSKRKPQIEQEAMYSYMVSHNYRTGIYTRIYCEALLAQEIYQKIKKLHPDIDDETIIKYFKLELAQRRTAKKLSLDKKPSSNI